MRYIYTLIIIILNCCSSSFSQNNILNDSNNKDLTTANITLIPDNPVAAMLDSLANSRFFNFDDSCDIFYNKYNFSEEYIPSYDDSTYRTRIKILDDKSPFDLVYNQDVRSFIELYAIKKRKLTARILGLAKLYFPYFEAQLDKFGLPLELKYLAVAESALNPVATSPAGAKGIWQFMYYTGKQYDLEVTSYIDERNDPYKSTIAACRHFIDLYNIYNDWTLVIAAYNCGAGNVNKAIRRAGGETNFWKIRQFLPAETQSYVPAFIAVNYVMNYAKEHNIYPIMPKITHYQIDTVQIKQLITFKQISEVINIPISKT